MSLGLFAAEVGLSDSISGPLLRTFGVNPWSATQRHSKLIFLHIAKCAGSSLLKQLPRGIVGSSNNHFAALQFWAHDANAFHQAFKFAVMRCPFERFVSAWRYALFSGRCDLIRNCIPLSVNETAELLTQPLGRRFLWTAPHFRPQASFLMAPVAESRRRVSGAERVEMAVDLFFGKF